MQEFASQSVYHVEKESITKNEQSYIVGKVEVGMSVEEMIIRLYASDKRAAFKLFYEHYAHKLMGICIRYLSNQDEAEDVMQEVLYKIYIGLGHFNYRGNGSLKAWSSRMVVNESIDYLRQKKRFVFIDNIMDMEDFVDATDEKIDGFVEEMPIEILQSMVDSLPIGYRTIFNLFLMEGYSHAQIASILGIKENSSSSQYHRARMILKKKIEKWMNEKK